MEENGSHTWRTTLWKCVNILLMILNLRRTRSTYESSIVNDLNPSWYYWTLHLLIYYSRILSFIYFAILAISTSVTPKIGLLFTAIFLSIVNEVTIAIQLLTEFIPFHIWEKKKRPANPITSLSYQNTGDVSLMIHDLAQSMTLSKAQRQQLPTDIYLVPIQSQSHFFLRLTLATH